MDSTLIRSGKRHVLVNQVATDSIGAVGAHQYWAGIYLYTADMALVGVYGSTGLLIYQRILPLINKGESE